MQFRRPLSDFLMSHCMVLERLKRPGGGSGWFPPRQVDFASRACVAFGGGTHTHKHKWARILEKDFSKIARIRYFPTLGKLFLFGGRKVLFSNDS